MPAKSVVIENPVINSPFDEPQRHFRFGEDGITDEIILGRRQSEYFVPIASPKKRGQRVLFETEWLEERRKENEFINKVRERVTRWRQGKHVGMTKTTRALLDYWTRDGRDRRLFFCQIEALETAIYLGEIAHKYGDAWIENDLRRAAEDSGSTLYRVAFKMATGSGKTVVMAMLIAWQTLNKLANAQDARFADAFLIVTPGITIRDRLRVLLPSDPGNYYRQLDVVPADLMPELGKAKITITNFHALRQQETTPAGKLTKALLRQGGNGDAFTETPEQMVRRVCRELGTKRGVVVINDEAHHCYRPKAADEDEDVERLKGEERREAEKCREEARVWITGLEAVNAKVGVKTIFDLSATPFYLRGSGYREGTLFPWVVSDFSLIDAIESGIVKVPRVPVADDAMTGEQPMYRELWTRIRDGLPKKGRGTEAVKGEPKLPTELEGALQSLYGNYEKAFALWGANAEARERGHTPPVFIVVCNNTNVSKLVFDYIAGWEKTLPDGSAVNVPGKLGLFSNVGADGRWLPRPTTILIDSEQLESGDAMSRDFKQIAAQEIEEFKGEYLRRFPGRSAEELTDEDLLREVLNTVGKIGKLGEQIPSPFRSPLPCSGAGQSLPKPSPTQPPRSPPAQARQGNQPPTARQQATVPPRPIMTPKMPQSAKVVHARALLQGWMTPMSSMLSRSKSLATTRTISAQRRLPLHPSRQARQVSQTTDCHFPQDPSSILRRPRAWHVLSLLPPHWLDLPSGSPSSRPHSCLMPPRPRTFHARRPAAPPARPPPPRRLRDRYRVVGCLRRPQSRQVPGDLLPAATSWFLLARPCRRGTTCVRRCPFNRSPTPSPPSPTASRCRQPLSPGKQSCSAPSTTPTASGRSSPPTGVRTFQFTSSSIPPGARMSFSSRRASPCPSSCAPASARLQNAPGGDLRPTPGTLRWRLASFYSSPSGRRRTHELRGPRAQVKG
ncbi:MAG: DEAD/DEAH box helicase family protein [Thermoanaerobaculaceae bacterium]|jgi:hypothetical protein